MGGIETDIRGATRVKGIWAGGEAACASLHGANRLGSNSTAECLVWGGITGAESARYCKEISRAAAVPDNNVEAERKRIFEDLLSRKGAENLYEIRRELRSCMDANAGVFRTGQGLSEGLEKIRTLRKRHNGIYMEDKSPVYNTNLYHALETANLLDLAEIMLMGALMRTESRGSHARRDYPVRDDANWLKHTLAFLTEKGLKLDYKPVTITTWRPVERKY
jgi:succinate dehydrogenase / fumarate reductase flavoprotein subunit